MGGLAPFSLIPVLVTGIQCERSSLHGVDTPWLDSCDKHRNEGVGGTDCIHSWAIEQKCTPSELARI
ncbi:hypothetical protein DSM25559_4765 [Agrobacterium rosae]|uniref:Uncharacterized protein n=1 Tax=Agrobacterium rosae TaxID=1972867 RepID=A0A1R3U8E1_9HYPH|nr:hypothetical protein DSM25559_4765 [Agrobacterium rosae]